MITQRRAQMKAVTGVCAVLSMAAICFAAPSSADPMPIGCESPGFNLSPSCQQWWSGDTSGPLAPNPMLAPNPELNPSPMLTPAD